jgi:ubiquinone/menaquinone biosynthesis C-methylase UbiE
MLERVLEPEVMDSELDAHEYATFDNRAVNDEFVSRALELAPPSGYVLDVGTGPGDIAVLFASRAPALRFLAIDLGEHMLSMARRNVLDAKLSERVEIARLDAKATERPSGSFDMIISNSLVHHIPDPEALFRELRRIARPGAGLFIKDLHRPASSSELRALVDKYAQGCTPYQTQTFYDSLHAALTAEEVTAMLRGLGWDDLSARRCSDRHWCIERRASFAS